MTLLKVCGIRTASDRDMCISLGVELLGFNIYERSKRYVDPETLYDLINETVRPLSVIVAVDLDLKQWHVVLKKYSPGFIQLHGDETPGLIAELKKLYPTVKIIKKVELKQEQLDMFKQADYFLFDYIDAGYGGTGCRFDWSELKRFDKKILNKTFVAGGINCENIKEIIAYSPYAVDVATGSESIPGQKDPEKVKTLKRSIDNYVE